MLTILENNCTELMLKNSGNCAGRKIVWEKCINFKDFLQTSKLACYYLVFWALLALVIKVNVVSLCFWQKSPSGSILHDPGLQTLHVYLTICLIPKKMMVALSNINAAYTTCSTVLKPGQANYMYMVHVHVAEPSYTIMYCHESMLLLYMYSRSFLRFMNTCTYNYMWTYTVWSININN